MQALRSDVRQPRRLQSVAKKGMHRSWLRVQLNHLAPLASGLALRLWDLCHQHSRHGKSRSAA